MKVLKTQEEVLDFRNENSPKIIGFVPTMGALHSGHLSLIEKAKESSDIVIASIFVNPTQFDNASDLEKYPIQHSQDIQLLEEVGCDAVFIPSSKEEVYKNESSFQVDLQGLDKVLEGEHRSGHFDGVMRVVKLLFEIVQPNKAFFGLKDYQQFLIVKTMAYQLGLPIQIEGVDTKRSAEGLALSSRNERLNPTELEVALALSKTLRHAQSLLGTKPNQEIEQECLEQLKTVCKPEYFAIRNAADLSEMNEIGNNSVRGLVAAFVGDVRLIDNMELSPNK